MSNRGQALIEALLAGGLCFLGLTLLLKFGFKMIYANLIDELLEEHLLCRQTTNTQCDEVFAQKMQQLQIKNFNLAYDFANEEGQDLFEVHSPLAELKREKVLKLKDYAFK
jgi:hypothetical protein